MKICDEVYVHGYVDEIRNDVVIIRNDGGYFGTVPSEVNSSENPNNCTDCECTDDCSECKEAEHGCKDEPQTKFPCDNCANKGDHNGECSNCVADSDPIRWKTPSHYKPKTKSQKAIKDLQEYYGIKQEPMLSEMV